MKTVVLKRNGKLLDMFEVADVVKSIKAFRIVSKNDPEDEASDYYVLFFSFRIDDKYVYLTLIEPFSASSMHRRVIKVKELGLEMETKADSKAIVKYLIKDIPLDEDLMLFQLIDKSIGLDFQIEEEMDDIVFFE